MWNLEAACSLRSRKSQRVNLETIVAMHCRLAISKGGWVPPPTSPKWTTDTLTRKYWNTVRITWQNFKDIKKHPESPTWGIYHIQHATIRNHLVFLQINEFIAPIFVLDLGYQFSCVCHSWYMYVSKWTLAQARIRFQCELRGCVVLFTWKFISIARSIALNTATCF